MEFQKNTGNFSFGFGTQKTAGVGSLKDALIVKDSKADKKLIAKTAVKGAAAAALVLLSHSLRKKKK